MRRGAVRVGIVGLAVAVAGLTGCAASPHAPDGAGSVRNAAPAGPAADPATVRRLPPAEFDTASAGRVLVNVHIPDEGSLPGTDLDLPFDEVAARAAELPADKLTPLAIYCMTDHMSGIAGQELLRLGYTDIVELEGGMQAWRASGRALLPAGT